MAILAIALWGYLPTAAMDRLIVRRCLLGIVMGLGAIGTMLLPLQIQPGVIFDLRAPLLACAGLFGGVAAAAIATVLALSYRVHVAGVGVWAGSVGIVLTALIGTAAHSLISRRPNRFSDLPLVAGMVTLGTCLTILLLPAVPLAMAWQNIGPIILLNFAGTWLFALSLRREERHRMLIRTNAVYRAIIEALPDSLNAKDRNSRFLAANPATARLMRARSVDDLLGKSDVDFYPEDMARGFRAEELTVLGNAKIGPVDQEVEFPDGSRRWLTTLKTPLFDRNGKICGIITHNRDITEHKRLEADLQKTQTYLHEALTNMADGLVLYDTAGVILFCNQKYRDLFPVTADLRVEGSRFADILRLSVLRGEEAPKDDLDAWVVERVRSLHRPGERLIELTDGRCIEARTRQVNAVDTLIVFSDITARKQLERDLMHRASHDSLTGLPNRAEFEFQIKAAHQWAASHDGELAVMMLDLDRFKQVNDMFGHAVGDQLLIEVAARLQASVRAGDFVARLGGDEFAFLLAGANLEVAASSLAARVLKTLARPFQANDIELVPGGSVGLAYFPRDTTDPEELLTLADKALYNVKATGGGGWASIAPAPAAGNIQPKVGCTREPVFAEDRLAS